VAAKIEREFQSLQTLCEVILGKHLRAVGWSFKGSTVLYEVAHGAKSYATAHLSIAVDGHSFQGAVALLRSLMQGVGRSYQLSNIITPSRSEDGLEQVKVNESRGMYLLSTA
jgi:hypothetical protein